MLKPAADSAPRRQTTTLRKALDRLIEDELRTCTAITIVERVKESISSRLHIAQYEKHEALCSVSVVRLDRQVPRLPFEVIRKILEYVRNPQRDVTNWWPHKVLGPPVRLMKHVTIRSSESSNLTSTRGFDTMDLAVSVHIDRGNDMESVKHKLSPYLQYLHRFKVLEIRCHSLDDVNSVASIVDLCKPSFPYLEQLQITARHGPFKQYIPCMQIRNALSDTSCKRLKLVELCPCLLLSFHKHGLLHHVSTLV